MLHQNNDQKQQTSELCQQRLSLLELIKQRTTKEYNLHVKQVKEGIKNRVKKAKNIINANYGKKRDNI